MMRLLFGLSLITIRCAVLLLLPAAYTNPADHFMDLITVKNPITSEPSCPPVSHTDLLPDPAELRVYYKNVQVGSRTSCIRLLCQGCAVLYAGGWGLAGQGVRSMSVGARTAPSCKPTACNGVLCVACCLRMCVQVDMSLGAATPLRAVRQLVPWHRQYKVLLARALKEQIRWGGRTGSGCRAVPWAQEILVTLF